MIKIFGSLLKLGNGGGLTARPIPISFAQDILVEGLTTNGLNLIYPALSGKPKKEAIKKWSLTNFSYLA